MSLSPAETKADLTRSKASSSGNELIQFCRRNRSQSHDSCCNLKFAGVFVPRELRQVQNICMDSYVKPSQGTDN